MIRIRRFSERHGKLGGRKEREKCVLGSQGFTAAYCSFVELYVKAELGVQAQLRLSSRTPVYQHHET